MCQPCDGCCSVSPAPGHAGASTSDLHAPVYQFSPLEGLKPCRYVHGKYVHSSPFGRQGGKNCKSSRSRNEVILVQGASVR